MTSENIDIPPPGEFIREELEARGWTQRDLAFVLGVPEQAVNLIVSNKRSITPDTARSLADAFDVSPEFFLNLQSAYDLSKAKRPSADVALRGRLQSVYPIREMIKRHWLEEGDTASLEGQLAKFFESESADAIPHLQHAAKKSSAYDEVLPIQVAWLFRVRHLARRMVTVKPYSPKELRESMDRLRALMSAPEEARHVPRILSECGVRYVLVESLPGAKIDGACFWNAGQPVIGMSCRHDRIDNFWFVLRHEIEHVLRGHGKEAAVVDDLDGDRGGTEGVSEEEREANVAGAEFCVSSTKLDNFIARKAPYIGERDIVNFAATMGVHPGIVAGRLRWRLNEYRRFSKLLAKVRMHVLATALVDGWGQFAGSHF